MKRMTFILIIICLATVFAACGDESDRRGEMYTVIVAECDGGTVICDRTDAHCGDMLSLSAQPDYGYVFNCFKVNGVRASGNIIMPNKDITVSASFDPDPNVTWHTIIVEPHPNATLSVSRKSAPRGQRVKTNVEVQPGYLVDKLYVNGTSIDNAEFTMPDGDTIVSVSVKRDDTLYSITCINDRYGRVICAAASAKAGSKVGFDCYPLNGYVLECYTVNGGTVQADDGTIVMPACDITVSARFKKAIEYSDVVIETYGDNSTAYSYWYFSYGRDSFDITVKVKDFTPVYTGDAVLQDGVDIVIASETRGGLLVADRAVKITVAAGGQCFANIALSGHGFGDTIQSDKTVAVVTHKELLKKDGYSGYEVKLKVQYSLIGSTLSECFGKLTVCPGLRNSESLVKTRYTSYCDALEAANYIRIYR